MAEVSASRSTVSSQQAASFPDSRSQNRWPRLRLARSSLEKRDGCQPETPEAVIADQGPVEICGQLGFAVPQQPQHLGRRDGPAVFDNLIDGPPTASRRRDGANEANTLVLRDVSLGFTLAAGVHF